jgi:hypothetical protein
MAWQTAFLESFAHEEDPAVFEDYVEQALDSARKLREFENRGVDPLDGHFSTEKFIEALEGVRARVARMKEGY